MFEGYLKKAILKEREEFNKGMEPELAKVTVPDDVVFGQLVSPGSKYMVDMYVPLGAEGKMPALVNIHGGGLVMGTNAQNKLYCIRMAQMGYIVFAVDYSLVPEVTAMMQLDEVCRGMNTVNQWLDGASQWDGRVFGTGDSAGAFLLMYSCAISADQNIADAFGVRGTDLKFDALAFQNGMFYSTRKDKIGMISNLVFNSGFRKKPFYKYLDPENPDVIKALPPFMAVTTPKDFLRDYTIDFMKVVEKKREDCRLVTFRELGTLEHAEAATKPDLEESRIVNEKIDKFFKSL